jgi:3D (Asp-Asp-Asp) domain-containing protein
VRCVGLALAAAALALACRSPAPAPRPPDAPRAPARVAPEANSPPEPAPAQATPAQQELIVTATAYNSLRAQGVGGSKHGAWGDRLRPGMKAVAVSHDLIALGITRGAIVRIEGLAGEFVVLDRLPRRWKRRIDIYMGNDVRAARRWGRRQLQIFWQPAAPASPDQNVGDGSELTIHMAK